MVRPTILEVLGPGSSPIPWSAYVSVERAQGIDEARSRLATGTYDAVVLHDCEDAERLIRSCEVPLLVVAATREVERAMALGRAGANDYVEPANCEVACLALVATPPDPDPTTEPFDRDRFRGVQASLIERERLATVGKLAAGVAHSINNPAAYVVANLDELRECLRPLEGLTTAALSTARLSGTPEQREAIERLATLARVPEVFAEIGDMLAECLEGMGRIRDIVHDLKGYSDFEDETPLPTDLARVVETALQLAQSDLRHRVKLEVDLPELPPVLGSGGRLSQVVLQLLLNALQSFDDHHRGERIVEITASPDDGAVELTVRDNGRGMSAETLRHVWDPFYTTHTRGALGLGLPICQEIISRHGGTLTITSHLDEGTAVVVRLPSMQDAVHFSLMELAPEGATDPLESARILVVDDEPAIVRCIKRLLRAAQEVDTATSGREALDILLDGASPDLILCDLMMSDVSGVELYERVCIERPELEPRMLFITGGAFTERTRAFCDQHIERLIEKPFESAALRDRLRVALTTMARAS